MTLELQECGNNIENKDLFEDLLNYERIASWIKALSERKTKYNPLECYLTIDTDGEEITFSIVEDGEPLKDQARQAMIAMYGLDEDYMTIPNDYLHVEADVFEKTLYIYPCGRSEIID